IAGYFRSRSRTSLQNNGVPRKRAKSDRWELTPIAGGGPDGESETSGSSKGKAQMAIIAYLYYKDVATVQRFLAKAFGFRKCGPTNKDARGKIKHSAMMLGHDVVMMGWPGPSYKNPRELGQATQCLFINVVNVDEHFERARKAGAKIIQELG